MNDKSTAGAAEIELAQQAAETSGAEKPPARRPRTVPYRPRIDTEQTTVEKDYRLRMPSLKEFRAEQFEERRHLLFPWLREQESCMIYAATGVGKSMFALSAALAIAGGGEFLGWTVDEKNTGDGESTGDEKSSGDEKSTGGWRVLYVDGEMHASDIQERVELLLNAILRLIKPRPSGTCTFFHDNSKRLM